jgi:predicted DNA-binding transcriptional regulator AlpA
MPKQPNKGEAAAPPPETTPPKPPRPFTKLYSRKELLAVMPSGMTYPTVWSLIQKGILPEAVEIGGRIGWKDNELLDAIDQLPRRTPKGSEPER